MVAVARWLPDLSSAQGLTDVRASDLDSRQPMTRQLVMRQAQEKIPTITLQSTGANRLGSTCIHVIWLAGTLHVIWLSPTAHP